MSKILKRCLMNLFGGAAEALTLNLNKLCYLSEYKIRLIVNCAHAQ